MAIKAVNRTREAIEELLTRQGLDATPGLEVRLSPQNQVYLNTWRPTRAAIPTSLLEKLVPGFRAGTPCFLQISNVEKDVTTYHCYFGGPTWVPSVPDTMGHPDDVFHITIGPLTPQAFLARFPTLMYSNESFLIRRMADEALLKVRPEGRSFMMQVEQWPEINGVNDYGVRCTVTGGLVHQTGSTILPF